MFILKNNIVCGFSLITQNSIIYHVNRVIAIDIPSVVEMSMFFKVTNTFQVHHSNKTEEFVFLYANMILRNTIRHIKAF